MLLDTEHNRIRKLLSSEYCDFADELLVESPFAETTRDGRGLRQVALGLTPSRLVIAADVLHENSKFTCPPDLDPSIESFELVSVYPLEFVNLSVFRRRRRKTLKARLIDGRAKYYELGGMLHRKTVFWNTWCDHVRENMAKNEKTSSMSETTAASSTTTSSTCCLVSSGVEFDNENFEFENNRCVRRVWAHYGDGDDERSTRWPRKDVYLGPSFNQLNHGYYTPVPVRFAGASLDDVTHELNPRPNDLRRSPGKKITSSCPCAKNPQNFDHANHHHRDNRRSALCDVLFTRERRRANPNSPDLHNQWKNSYQPQKRMAMSETLQIDSRDRKIDDKRRKQKHRCQSPRKNDKKVLKKLSRFGFGINENCNSGLCLKPWFGDDDHYCHGDREKVMDLRGMMENSVRLWEGRVRKKLGTKNSRNYGFAGSPFFLHGLGPWSVQPGDRQSVQRKRSCSAIATTRRTTELDVKIPISKRQLSTSTSMTELRAKKIGAIFENFTCNVVIFWTPEYWYRPRSATTAYRELRKHLDNLQKFRIFKEHEKQNGRKSFFAKNKMAAITRNQSRDGDWCLRERKSCGLLERIFSSNSACAKRKNVAKAGNMNSDCGIERLKCLLRMDLRITAWDIDSENFARQLTIIDRDLFLRVTWFDVEILFRERSSINASNIGAWIAFSHRVSCLVTSELLSTRKISMRTRLMSRFINVAKKCYDYGNFHSCRSIVAGLQSPAIYRLTLTWSRLKIHHSTRYEIFKSLCQIFRNTRTKIYRKVWEKCEIERSTILPYVGDVIARIVVDDELPIAKKCSSSNSRTNDRHWPTISSNFSNLTYNENVALKKIVEPEKIIDKNVIRVEENFGKKILSAAIMRIRGKIVSTNFHVENDVVRGFRDEILKRWVCDRWRKFVADSRIIRERTSQLENADWERRKIRKICDWMAKCQKQCRGYEFGGHSLAWEFLLKARYREERENFFISLKVEPPCG